MIESISQLCEMLAILIVLHRLLNRKIRLNIAVIILLVINIAVYWLIELKMIPGTLHLIIYVAFFLYLLTEFKTEKTGKIVVCASCAVFIVSGLQMISYVLLAVVQNVTIRIAIFNILLFFVLFIMYYTEDFWKNGIRIIRKNRILYLVMTFCGAFFLLLSVLSRWFGLSFLNCLLIAVITLVVIIFCQQWKVEREQNLIHEREIRVLQKCNESFEHLIQTVRSRQHEFDNQIETIYSLQYVCKTYEELVDKQNEYIAHVVKENAFSKLLTLECSSIIKGFLYYKFSQAYQKGINIEYEIRLGRLKDASLEFDIQEIAGVLFDNACEGIGDIVDNRCIKVCIKREDDYIVIRMENPAEYMSQNEMQKYFKMGQSSKGKNRGFGLSNMNQIVQKYKGMIQVQNIERAEQNWISISALLRCKDEMFSVFD